MRKKMKGKLFGNVRLEKYEYKINSFVIFFAILLN